jgi:hypothetical protein
MVAVMDGLIVLDDKGIARIAGSRIRVVDLVLDRQTYEWTPARCTNRVEFLPL